MPWSRTVSLTVGSAAMAFILMAFYLHAPLLPTVLGTLGASGWILLKARGKAKQIPSDGGSR